MVAVPLAKEKAGGPDLGTTGEISRTKEG